MEAIWPLVTVIGPILLLAALAWAMLNNRRSRRAEQQTEAATRRNYAEQDAEDKAREAD